MTDNLPADPAYFVERLRALQTGLRDQVRARRDASALDAMAAVGEHREGDTLYAIDIASEEVLLACCERWAQEMPFALVAEGIPGDGWRVFPDGASRDDARFCLVVDPIDGTRGLMYDKRGAWILSGIAPNRGPDTALSDIAIAMQTEIPTTRQYLSDVLWAVRGHGVRAERQNILTRSVSPFAPRPSGAATIAHGFATISKFFPGARDITARLEDALVERILGVPADGNPLVFDDEYISTGGQLYELVVGHDRFIADLRPLSLAAKYPGVPARLCCHPYDICTALVAEEAGILLTGPQGERLDARLDVRENVAWIGYANEAIRAQVEPSLLDMLRHGTWGA